MSRTRHAANASSAAADDHHSSHPRHRAKASVGLASESSSGGVGAKGKRAGADASSSSTAPARHSKKESDSDASDDEPTADSDDDDAPTIAAKKLRAAADASEKSSLSSYLSSPSTYSSGGPALPLSAEEVASRLEVEELLGRLKKHQKSLMDARKQNQSELDSMKSAVKRIRKDTEELIKNQQTNLATMGRKLQ